MTKINLTKVGGFLLLTTLILISGCSAKYECNINETGTKIVTNIMGTEVKICDGEDFLSVEEYERLQSIYAKGFLEGQRDIVIRVNQGDFPLIQIQNDTNATTEVNWFPFRDVCGAVE